MASAARLAHCTLFVLAPGGPIPLTALQLAVFSNWTCVMLLQSRGGYGYGYDQASSHAGYVYMPVALSPARYDNNWCMQVWAHNVLRVASQAGRARQARQQLLHAFTSPGLRVHSARASMH